MFFSKEGYDTQYVFKITKKTEKKRFEIKSAPK